MWLAKRQRTIIKMCLPFYCEIRQKVVCTVMKKKRIKTISMDQNYVYVFGSRLDKLFYILE